MPPIPIPIPGALSLTSVPASPPPFTPAQPGNQSEWGPDTISNIVFGVVMFFVGVVALWQGRQRRLREGGKLAREHWVPGLAD